VSPVRRSTFWLACVCLAFPPLLAAERQPDFLQEARRYRQRGYEAQQEGRLDEALLYYQQAVHLDPSFAAAYNDVGLIYEATGWPQQAQESYLKCVEIDSHCLNGYANLAALAEDQADWSTAARYWNKRAGLGSPTDPRTLRARRRVEELATAMKTGSRPPPLHHDLQPQPAQAAQSLTQERDAARQERDAARQERDAAQQDLAKLRQVHEALQTELAARAKAAQDLEAANQALQTERHALTQETAVLQEERARLAQERDAARQERDTAQQDLAKLRQTHDTLQTQLERLTPAKEDLVALYHQLGVAYTQLKLYPQAIEAYEKCLTLNPKHAEAHHHLGLLYKHVRQDSERATRHLQEYLRLTPDASDRKQLEILLRLSQHR